MRRSGSSRPRLCIELNTVFPLNVRKLYHRFRRRCKPSRIDCPFPCEYDLKSGLLISARSKGPKARSGVPGHMSRFLLIASCALVAIAAPISHNAHALEAGAAKVEITPEPGLSLDGYLYRQGRPAVMANDPLWVRALYLSDGETELFLVSADLYAISSALRERVLELVPADVPDEHVVLTATNTHNGPGGLSPSWFDRQRSGRFLPDFLETTAQKFSEAMRAAYDARRRAAIGHGTTRQEGLTRNRFRTTGITDPQIGVIRIEDSDGNPIAIVGSLSAAAATIPRGSAFAYSADFPGYFCDALEQMTETPTIAMFLSGSTGDQSCAPADTFESAGWAEQVGRALALRVKALANNIQGREPSIDIGYIDAPLPPSMGPNFHTEKAIVQTLEIGELILNFFPGQVYAALGLDLREQALQRGYDAQWTVGSANGRLGAFTSLESFANYDEEFGALLFGPEIADWTLETASQLMTRGKHKLREDLEFSAPHREPLGAGSRITLEGSRYEMGRQLGLAYRSEIHDALQRRAGELIEAGTIQGGEGLWRAGGRYLDYAALLLPDLANRARPLLNNVSESTIEELQGLADGAGLPFPYVWLLQAIPRLLEDETALPELRGTLFAIGEGRAGEDGVVAGQNLHWSHDERPVAVQRRPDSGRGHISLGFPWSTGVLSGMNDAGVVLCVERDPELGRPDSNAPFIEFILRDLIESAVDFEDALEALTAIENLRGYRVLVADRPLTGVAFVEYGANTNVRFADEGLLSRSDESTHRVQRLLRGQALVEVERIKTILLDQGRRADPEAWIFAPQTRYIAVFQPGATRAHIAFPVDHTSTVAFESIVLQKDAP